MKINRDKDPIRYRLLPGFNEKINWVDKFLFYSAALSCLICWIIAGVFYLLNM
jgi:hypothetical protein